MADPKLKQTEVVIRYKSDDGYRCKVVFIGNEKPEIGFLQALDELSRLTSLFGFDDEALAAFNSARERVSEWKSRRIG
jgi:hypothetical protein